MLLDVQTTGEGEIQRAKETASGQDLAFVSRLERILWLNQLTLDPAASNFRLLLDRATRLRHLKIDSCSRWICYVADFWPLFVRLHSLQDPSVEGFPNTSCHLRIVEACSRLRSAVRKVWLRKRAPLQSQDIKSLATDPSMVAAERFLLDNDIATRVATAWNEDEDKGPSPRIRWKSVRDLRSYATGLKWSNLRDIDVGRLWDDLYDEDDSDPEIPPPVPSDFLKNHGLDR